MRISYWSSDVCSSDPIPANDPRRLITLSYWHVRGIEPAPAPSNRIAGSSLVQLPRCGARNRYRARLLLRRLGRGRSCIKAVRGQHLLVCGHRGLVFAEVRVQVDRHLERDTRSEEPTSELQSLMRNSYAVFCLK